ncbi:MAG: hypothetical protein RMJ19_04065 [Gemmatales bacterium]|nr:hypothetical protein [Gemmatales bacterium]MDW8174822.1 hypothetical protein [Gemmatales bacterium]
MPTLAAQAVQLDWVISGGEKVKKCRTFYALWIRMLSKQLTCDGEKRRNAWRFIHSSSSLRAAQLRRWQAELSPTATVHVVWLGQVIWGGRTHMGVATGRGRGELAVDLEEFALSLIVLKWQGMWHPESWQLTVTARYCSRSRCLWAR